MSRLPASQVRSGQVVEARFEGGYTAQITLADKSGKDTVTLHMTVTVPPTHEVELVDDPLRGLLESDWPEGIDLS
ncbi:MAG: hypothetical protein M3N32_07880 [Actinomycetota bacterium]|nr:hypothetical protein [Actinomycetota bacterium]